MPPILFIISLIAFIFAILPLFTELYLAFPDEISSVREKVLRVIYSGVIGGVVFLVAAMVVTIDVCVKILRV
jgi:hypothetical protein